MNRISEITKLDILDLFQNGIEIYEVFETRRVNYLYYGRLDELDFLKRIYNLNSMASLDSRFQDAEEEILQHTIRNDDYPYCWIFNDERFQLKYGNDEIYLKFICEIFHPAVRDENTYWNNFLTKINKLLKHDGYEIYPAEKISNRDVYSWRLYNPESEIFIPYSQRNEKAIKQKRIEFSIKRKARHQIYQLLEKYNNNNRKITETGWQYEILTSEEAFNDLRSFYVPKCFNEKSQYVETKCLKDFIYSTSPYSIFDMIEIFYIYTNNDFEEEVNAIFKLNQISFRINNGKIITITDSYPIYKALPLIEEVGLKELVQEANLYYEKGNLKIAVEKIWDGFERLKTYYSPSLNKKNSTTKIIEKMSGKQEPYMEMFEKEFWELTQVGNNFRIRHHETIKTDIEDNRHYDYFYKRCLSLITIAVQYLD